VSRLAGKVAIITGAARGTGAETARLFAAEGAQVVLADVSDASSGPGLYVRTDVSSEADWKALVDRTVSEFGRVDVLVNNAAILVLASFQDTTVEDYERVWRVNELGCFLGIKSVIEAMKAAGGGSIVNVSSIDGVYATPGSAAYAATKFGVRGLTKTAALELGRFNIRVNCVCPNAGSPDMVADTLGMEPGAVEKMIASFERHLPLGHGGTLRDIANTILFLASDDSAFFTGADLVPDGGLTAGQIIKGSPGT
jgi:3alpha(or 20beta)-hydroxysteroid dehydrogenase